MMMMVMMRFVMFLALCSKHVVTFRARYDRCAKAQKHGPERLSSVPEIVQ